MSVDVMLLDPEAHSALYLDGFVRDGALVAITRASRRPYALHLDVLNAMGCRTDVRGSSTRRGPGRELELITAWASAHRFADVYLCHADYVPNPRWFEPLADAFARAGAAVHLVSDNATGERLCDWADSEGHPILTEPPALPAAVPTVAIRDADDDFPQMLPEADFYLWLARCRDLLSPADLGKVLGLYRKVFDRWFTLPPRGGEDARRRIVNLVADHPTQGEVLTCVRAAQAACFRHGLLLRLKIPHLLATVQDGEARRLDPAEIRALHAYHEPWIACAVVLRDAGYDNRIADSLRLDGVDDDGRITNKRRKGQPLAPDARLFMRAQRALRLGDGADQTDKLFTRPVRDMADAIRWSRMDLNLPGVTRAHASKENDWIDRMRLTVHDLGAGTQL